MICLRNKTLSFLLLALATLLFNLTVEPYRPVGDELLYNPDFRLGLQGWQAGGPDGSVKPLDDGSIELYSESSDSTVSLVQTLSGLPHAGQLQLTAELASKSVVAGSRSWHRGRLVMARYDADGNWLTLTSQVAALVGDMPWRRYTEDFSLEETAAKTEVVLQLAQASGHLWARGVSLRETLPNPLFAAGQVLAFVFWGCFIVGLLSPYSKNRSHLLLRLGILLTAGLILVGILLPGTIKGGWGSELSSIFSQAQLQLVDKVESELTKYMIFIRQICSAVHISLIKAGHFTLFALMTLMLGLVKDELRRFAVLYDAILLAAATELLQFFIAGRTPLFSDFVIDVAGACLGLLLAVFVRSTFKRFSSVPPLLVE